MTVIILGCGPSGLLAAHAAAEYTDDIKVLSIKRKSEMPGAQYCSEAIPGLTDDPDAFVTFHKMGDARGYAEKVYGDPDHPCSWDKFMDGEEVPAWSMKALYHRLWNKYEHLITDTIMTRDDVDMMISDLCVSASNDVVLSSIPRPNICHGGHKFDSVNIWIAPYAWRDVEDGEIIYNGEPNVPWYRSCSLFGYDYTEFVRPGSRWMYKGIKPTGHNCNCFDGAMTHIGRFGRWEKGVLIADAYNEARRALEAASLHAM